MNYISLQEDELDCGFACLKMQLAYVHKNRQFLSLEKEKRNKEYSFSELKKIASNYNLQIEGVEVEQKDKIFDYKYSICQLKINEKTHFVLLVKANKKTVIINDPTFGQVEMSKEDFLELFTNYALIENNHSKISYKNFHRLVNLSHLILYVFTLVIDFSLLYFLGYFGSDSNYLTLSIFVLVGIIVSMISKSVIINSQNNKIDEKIKEMLIDLSEQKFVLSELEKRHLLSLKGNMVNAIFNNLNNIAISIFICVILLMNGLYNLIIILIISTVIIINKMLDDSKNQYIKYRLLIDENAFMQTNVNLDIIYGRLSNNSLNFVKSNLTSSILVYALIVILIVGSNYLMNINSFTYIIFFIAYYYVLSEKIQNLVNNFDEKFNNYNASKNLYFGILKVIKQNKSI